MLTNKKHDGSITGSTVAALHCVEDIILIGLLVLMIGMAVTQIFLRNFFDSGIIWGDVLIRILVLWIGLVGAMTASRQDKHICIDVVTRYLPERAKHISKSVTQLVTASVCAIVTYYSLEFVRMEVEYGGNAFAAIPVWVCEAVIPAAFAVMALRHFILSFTSLKTIFKPPL
ncbi:MAG: TRAP transporter small permease [Thermodesulfobacteriota bacterium]|nr:TRAP transporter small permease [Thermodesulfobacteriota bacterium]